MKKPEIDPKKPEIDPIFALGEENPFGQYFVGQSYLKMLCTEGVGIGNVTFEPGCRNNWHIHHAQKGGGQILLCTVGKGWYQEWGKPAQQLHPGDVVKIPAGVKHWHGAGQALARRGEGQLVCAPFGRGAGRGDQQRMAGAGGRPELQRAVRDDLNRWEQEVPGFEKMVRGFDDRRPALFPVRLHTGGGFCTEPSFCAKRAAGAANCRHGNNSAGTADS